MDPSLKDLEEAEVQKYIRQYQDFTPAQLEKLLREAAQFTPTQEQNLPIQKALVILLEQTDPAPQEDPLKALEEFLAQREPQKRARSRPQKRLLIVAAVLAALLALTAAAYAVQHWGLFLNIQEEFIQPRTAPGPEATVKTWTELPIPTDTPQGFYISDAASGDGTSTIEYSNSEGQRFSVSSIIVPITNVMNDNYCYQTSKKIRQVFDYKRRNGQYIGAFAPYGYIKHPNDKHQLMVDPEAAEVVKLIFSMCLQGTAKLATAMYLNEHGVPSPTAYKRLKGIPHPTSAENDIEASTHRYLLVALKPTLNNSR